MRFGMTSQHQTAAVASMLRMLAHIVDKAPTSASGDHYKAGYASAIAMGAHECMRAIDKLCDALPPGDALDRAMQQVWDVSPVPPDASTLRRWATGWDHYTEAAEAA